MTELQFLIDLLLNHKLNSTTKKLVADRIGQVEANYVKAPTQMTQSTLTRNPTAQCASTQAILDRAPLDVTNPTISIPLTQAMVAPQQSMSASNRIIGGEVNTGKGTKGPRKF